MRIGEYTQNIERRLKYLGYKVHLPKNIIKKAMKKYENPLRYTLYLLYHQKDLLKPLQRKSKSKSE